MTNKLGYWTRLHGVATLILFGAALYFLFVEHRDHVVQYFPFLIILLCPLMHLFMHKGHGGHSHGHGEQGVDGHQHHDAEEAYRRGLEEGRKEAGKRP